MDEFETSCESVNQTKILCKYRKYSSDADPCISPGQDFFDFFFVLFCFLTNRITGLERWFNGLKITSCSSRRPKFVPRTHNSWLINSTFRESTAFQVSTDTCTYKKHIHKNRHIYTLKKVK